MSGPLKCTRCAERPSVSASMRLCEVCAYEELVGKAAASRQTAHLATAPKRAVKGADRGPA